jgi:hypothetical protein
MRDQHAQGMFADDAMQDLGPGFGKMLGDVHG